MAYQYTDPNVYQYYNEQYLNQQIFGYPQLNVAYHQNGMWANTNSNTQQRHTPYAINKRPKDDLTDDETEPNFTNKYYKNPQVFIYTFMSHIMYYLQFSLQKAAKKSSKNKPERSMTQDEEKKSAAPLDTTPLDTIENLQKLHKKWEKSINTNVENLGIYLKGIVDGYEYNGNGYGKMIMFFGSSRTFCESVCNYILCGGMNRSTLFQKIEHLGFYGYDKYQCGGFPQTEMHDVRQATNKIMHGVGYNESATKCFISSSEQKETLETIVEIATWIDEYMSKYQ